MWCCIPVTPSRQRQRETITSSRPAQEKLVLVKPYVKNKVNTDQKKRRTERNKKKKGWGPGLK
jgi:hypothetical protein